MLSNDVKPIARDEATLELCCSGLNFAPCPLAKGPDHCWLTIKGREITIEWIKKASDHHLLVICELAYDLLKCANINEFSLLQFTQSLDLFPAPILCNYLLSTREYDDRLFKIWSAIPEEDKQLFYEFTVERVLDHVCYKFIHQNNDQVILDFVHRGMCERIPEKPQAKILIDKLIRIAISEKDLLAVKKILLISKDGLNLEKSVIDDYLKSSVIMRDIALAQLFIDMGANLGKFPTILHVFINSAPQAATREMLPFLIQQSAQVTALDTNTFTPLAKFINCCNMFEDDAFVFRTLIVHENPKNLRSLALLALKQGCKNGKQIESTLSLFKEYGLDLLKDPTLLDLICKLAVPGRGKVVQFLLDNGFKELLQNRNSILAINNAAEAYLNTSIVADDVIEALLAAGDSLKKITDSKLRFYLACRFGQLHILKKWLGTFPLNFSAHPGRLQFGETPFYAAIERGHLDVYRFLVKSYPDLCENYFKMAYIAIAAARNGHVDMFDAIVKDVPSIPWHRYSPFVEISKGKHAVTALLKIYRSYPDWIWHIQDGNGNFFENICTNLATNPKKQEHYLKLIFLFFEWIRSYSTEDKEKILRRGFIRLFSPKNNCLFNIPRLERSEIFDILFTKRQWEILNRKGQTPLHRIYEMFSHNTLSLSDWEEIKSRLIVCQPDFSEKNFDGVTPLNLICRHQAKNFEPIKDMIHFAWNQGGNHAIFPQSQTPLHETTALQEPIPYIQELLKLGHPINIPNEQGNTPLHIAVEKGNKKSVACLIEANADCKVLNENGKTPLSLALGMKALDILAILLKYDQLRKKSHVITRAHFQLKSPILEIVIAKLGEEPDGIKAIGCMRRTSFSVKERIDNIILKGVMFRMSFDKSPLQFVAFHVTKGANERLNHLYRRHENRRNSMSHEIIASKTLISLLANAYKHNSMNEISQALHFEKPLFNLREYCNDGYTALHYACSSEATIDHIDFLLANGAMLDQPSKAGTTALSCAVQMGRLDVVKFLLEKGANVNGTGWSKENSPITWCSELIEEKREMILPMVRLLLDAGANVHSRDKKGNTLLHIAAKWGHFELIKELVENRKFAINTQDTLGLTALSHASTIEIIQYLLKFGCQVKQSNEIQFKRPNEIQSGFNISFRHYVAQSFQTNNWHSVIEKICNFCCTPHAFYLVEIPFIELVIDYLSHNNKLIGLQIPLRLNTADTDLKTFKIVKSLEPAFSSLTIFDAFGNGDIPKFLSFSRIKKLTLSNCENLTDLGLQHLARFVELETLYLHHPSEKLSGDFLINIRKLNYLEIYRAKDNSKLIFNITNLISLSKLRLNGLRDGDSDGWLGLSKMRSLVALSIIGTDINDKALCQIAQLPKLLTLKLISNKRMSNLGILALMKIKTLRKLDLSENPQLTIEAIKTLLFCVPLIDLNVAGTLPDDTALITLQALFPKCRIQKN